MGGNHRGILATGLFVDPGNQGIPSIGVRGLDRGAVDQGGRAGIVFDLVGQGDCRNPQIAISDIRNFVDQAVIMGGGGRHRFAAGDYGNRVFNRDQAGQSHGATGTGDQAKIDFGQAQFGGGGRDAVMTAEGDFKPATKRITVDGCDQWLGRLFEFEDQIGQDRVDWRFAKFGNIGTGDKG